MRFGLAKLTAQQIEKASLSYVDRIAPSRQIIMPEVLLEPVGPATSAADNHPLRVVEMEHGVQLSTAVGQLPHSVVDPGDHTLRC